MTAASAASQSLPRRRGRGDFNCNDLLEQQERSHKRAMEAQANALKLLMEQADRASERRDNTMRFIAFAALTILGGLVGIKLTGINLGGFFAIGAALHFK